VTEETGIDLSEVPMCVQCGLEVANRTEHNIWHAQQQSAFQVLETRVLTLEQTIRDLIATVSTATGRIHQTWVNPPTQNPYTQKWDKL
jgi:hypothetical protein